MAEFTYTGVDRQGNKVNGKLAAGSEGEVRMLLRSQGIRPLRLSTGAFSMDQDIFAMLKPKAGTGSVPIGILAAFTRQLQVLLQSGIPLVTALEILGEQNDSIHLRHAILDIKEKVSGGSYFWESVSGFPRIFPRLYSSLVRAGEASGAMEQILDRLANYIESMERLSKQMKSAMFYPVMVGLVGVGVIAGMLTFVIPKFEEMLKANNAQLPWVTQALVDTSHFVTNHFLILFAGIFSFGYLLVRYIRSPEGRGVFDRLLFSTPVFGKLIQKAGIARFSRTLATLLASGVPLVEAIDIVKNTVDNSVIEEQVSRIRKSLEDGQTLSATLGRLPAFPKMTVQMVRVGESTGSLEKMLDRMAKIYEQDVETMVAGLAKLIEPVILVVLGGLVGGILIAMYLPIFSMAQGVG
jgi:type IV pilus assembly protein PilC